MVSLVISDDKLAVFCTAIMDEKMRDIILLLQNGPLRQAQVSKALGISDDDAKSRLAELESSGLVRRTTSSTAPDIYSLCFSIEKMGVCPDQQIASELSSGLSSTFLKFLEYNSEKISAICDSTGTSLGRTVEQLFLSSVSRIIRNLQDEMQEEDKRLILAFEKIPIDEE